MASGPKGIGRYCRWLQLQERQLFLRTNGRFRFVVVPVWLQAAAILFTVALSAAAGWAAFAPSTDTPDRYKARLAALIAEHQRMAASARQDRSRADGLEALLARKRALLERANAQNAALQRHGAALEAELSQAEDLLHRASTERQGLNGELSASRLRARRDAQELFDLRNALAATERRLRSLRQAHDESNQESRQLHQKMAKLKAKLVALSRAHERFVARLEATAADRIDELEALLDRAGLDPDLLLERLANAEGPGAGGPFLALPLRTANGRSAGDSDPGRRPDPELPQTADAIGTSVAELSPQIQRWSALREAMDALPLGAPVREVRVTSGFGKRRDPFRQSWSMHQGIDLGGGDHEPVYSTASGVVTAAGWQGAYGRMIEIDHGHGLSTRYAHLRSISVKRGQRVDARQLIGAMGSSGRSTGVHLHYEVRFDDQPLDPARLLQAGRLIRTSSDVHAQ